MITHILDKLNYKWTNLIIILQMSEVKSGLPGEEWEEKLEWEFD